MDKLIVYGIPNCDTVKKTRDWLKKKKIGFQFHDYKKQGIGKVKLEDWCAKVGWEVLLNRKSATWRELSGAEQERATNQPMAIKIMMKNNSIIKRPVIEFGEKLVVGFDEEEYKMLFK